MDAVHDSLDLIDLIRAHHEELLLAGDEHHVAAEGLAEGAFDEEGRGEVVGVDDLFVVHPGELIDGEEPLILIEGEVAGVVVGEVEGLGAVADDEELEEAEEGLGVAVAGVVLVFDDLLHGPARADAEGLQLDLHAGHAVDEQEDVVTVVTVVGVDAELVDDLEVVFAPVLDVDQGVVQRRAVVAGEAVALAQGAGGGEDIGGDDFLQHAGEFTIGEADAIEGLEFFAEVGFQGGAVVDIGADGVFEATELLDEGVLDAVFV